MARQPARPRSMKVCFSPSIDTKRPDRSRPRAVIDPGDMHREMDAGSEGKRRQDRRDPVRDIHRSSAGSLKVSIERAVRRMARRRVLGAKVRRPLLPSVVRPRLRRPAWRARAARLRLPALSRRAGRQSRPWRSLIEPPTRATAGQSLDLVSWTERRVRAGWRWLRTSNLYRLVTPCSPVAPGNGPVFRRPSLTGQNARGA